MNTYFPTLRAYASVFHDLRSIATHTCTTYGDASAVGPYVV